MAYRWRDGSRIKANPDAAAEVMNGLASENRLNAGELVDVSRPSDAPLHPAFEWRDPIAAEEWRKHQARHMIRSLEIVVEEPKPPEPVYVQIRSSGSNYQPIRLVLKQKDTRTELLEQAYNEMKTFRSKYARLTELARVFRAIDEQVDGEDSEDGDGDD